MFVNMKRFLGSLTVTLVVIATQTSVFAAPDEHGKARGVSAEANGEIPWEALNSRFGNKIQRTLRGNTPPRSSTSLSNAFAHPPHGSKPRAAARTFSVTPSVAWTQRVNTKVVGKPEGARDTKKEHLSVRNTDVSFLTASRHTAGEPVTPASNVSAATISPPASELQSIDPVSAQAGSLTLLPFDELQSSSLPPNQAAGQAPALPATSATFRQQQGPIVLNEFRPLQPPHPVQGGGPINLIQFQPAEPQDTADVLKARRLRLEDMTGPMKPAAELIRQVASENDFRREKGIVQPQTRMTDVNAQGVGIEWGQNRYSIISPAFYYHPLYFEQPNLERFGVGTYPALQPAASAGHFIASVGLLPFKMWKQKPCERVYTLGYQRPGNCVPYLSNTICAEE